MALWIMLAVACSGPGSVIPDGSTDLPDPPTSPSLLQFVGETPKNLLFVSLDTTRRDSVGRYSTLPTLTPRLDTFLAESVALDAHWSCSNWTGPSMTCAVSGRTAAAGGFWPLTLEPGVDNVPPPGWETLASRLADAGRDTRLLTSNVTFGTNTGLDRGFEEVTEKQWMTGAEVTAAALGIVDVLQAVPATPWFFHVHYTDPHGPYCPPAELLDTTGLPAFEGDICEDFKALRASYWTQTPEWQAAYKEWTTAYYRAEIAAWDVAFGGLIDGLELRGALDDLLVVFLTDHGEQLGERGAWGHGILLGPEEIGSVAAFWAKNLPPVAWTGTTVHADVNATLQDLYGVPPTEPLEGVVVGTAAADRAVPIWNLGSGIGYSQYAEEWGGLADAYVSVVRGDLQLDYDWLGNRSLYRLDVDPGATVDTYDPTDPDVIDMWTTMSKTIAEISAAYAYLDDPVDPTP